MLPFLRAAQAAGIVAALTANPVFAEDKTVEIEVREGTSMSVAVSPDGRTLAIDLQGTLWTLPASGGVATRISDFLSDARQPVWSPDGSQLAFFAYRDGNYDLWAVGKDGTNLQQLTPGRFDDRDPAWSRDGRFIAFASDRGDGEQRSYDIWTLALESGDLRQISRDPAEERNPTWSPDGKQLAFTSLAEGKSTIRVVAAAGGPVQVLREADGRIDAPSWSADGRLAYVVLTPDRSRLEIDGSTVSGKEIVFPFRAAFAPRGVYYTADGRIRFREGSRVRDIPFTAKLPVSVPDYARRKRDTDSTASRRALGIVRPALSPAGDRVAFAALGDIHIVEADGSTRNLTHDPWLDADPAWSPDGQRIAYSSDKAGGLPQLWLRDLRTGVDRQLTRTMTQPLHAAWSPDGQRIAFIDVEGMWGVAGLAFVNVADGAITRLQLALPQPGAPSWSADGRYLALANVAPFSRSFREGVNQVYVIEAVAGAQPRWFEPVPGLSIDSRGGAGPVWSPDGAHMAAVFEGQLRLWPVSAKGEPLGPARTLTTEVAHAPSWAGDSRRLLYQSGDLLRTIDIADGESQTWPLDLRYQPAIPQGRLVLRVGALVDGESQRTRGASDIVIDGNRIVSVTPRSEKPYTSGERVIDASTLTAMPGLIESHAHVQKDFGSAVHRGWLAFGITTVRDPGNLPYHGVEDREANEAGVRIGPRIFTTGYLFEWQRAYYKMGVAISGPAHLERELERARVLEHDLLKSYVRLPEPQQQRVVRFAHSIGIPVTTHEIFPAALFGTDGTEHLGATSRRGFSPKQGPLGRAYQDVIQLAAASRRTFTPTHFGQLGDYLQKRPELREDPRVGLYPEWVQRGIKTDLRSPAAARPSAGTRDAIRDLVRAGVRVTAGTDTAVALYLHAELSSYVDAGLTPFEALRSATVVPAEALGIDAGVIAPGKLADIALVSGDPLTDITTTVNVKQVIANGRFHDLAELLNP